MSVLDHIETNVQVWDGKAFSYVPLKEAKKLVKAGTHQISTGLTSAQLKWPNEFKTRDVKAETPDTPVKKKTYKTRQMKAES